MIEDFGPVVKYTECQESSDVYWRGIGLAVAKEYAKQGDKVVISGRSDNAALERALFSLKENYARREWSIS